MHFIRKVFSLVFISLALLCACNSDKAVDSKEEQQTSTDVDDEKTQIQAFWQYYRSAQKHRAASEWEDAKRQYMKAINIDSTHEDAWFNLGNTHLEIGEYIEAQNCWKHIVDTNPNSARAHMQLGRLYLSYELEQIFDLDLAKKEFLSTSSINKVVTGPLMLLGHVALVEKDYKLARTYFLSVTGSDTKNSEAYFLLSYVAWKNQNSEKMIEYFEKAMLFSKPEVAVKGVLSEGDTKDSTTYLRPINESIFKEYFTGLDNINQGDISIQMRERYKATDLKLAAIRDQM